MSEISIFCDESGSDDGQSAYRLVTLVFHNQTDTFAENISRYERALDERGLERIPFHCSPLMYGTKAYRDIYVENRKQAFALFEIFAKTLPVKYHTFAYKRSEIPDSDKFADRLQRDIESFLDGHLAEFQEYDTVKIYYDNAQRAVSQALHRAIEVKLSKQAVMYREAHPSNYHLFQVADYICTIELAAIKYDHHKATETDMRFLGKTKRIFNKNHLKHVRRKLME